MSQLAVSLPKKGCAYAAGEGPQPHLPAPLVLAYSARDF